MKSKQVKIADLKRAQGTRAFLYCSECFGEYSADPSDYFMVTTDHVFKCCRRNMRLMVKRVIYSEVG